MSPTMLSNHMHQPALTNHGAASATASSPAVYPDVCFLPNVRTAPASSLAAGTTYGLPKPRAGFFPTSSSASLQHEISIEPFSSLKENEGGNENAITTNNIPLLQVDCPLFSPPVNNWDSHQPITPSPQSSSKRTLNDNSSGRNVPKVELENKKSCSNNEIGVEG